MNPDWRVEVFSCLTNEATERPDPLAGLLEKITELNKQLPPLDLAEAVARSSVQPGRAPNRAPESAPGAAEALTSLGLLSCHVERVLSHVRASPSASSARGPHKEFDHALAFLAGRWRKPGPLEGALPQTHVFIGPPGVGKTTVLSKWLAQVVLLGGRPARVFRLDGSVANSAESLSIYGEILGVPVDRTWPEQAPSEPIQFVDLPGVAWQDASYVASLARQLQKLGPAQIHLVLNAAYEVPLLFAQVEAYADIAIADLIFTHLDEEKQWGKLWNFVLGTNHAISFLSAGQNVPGDFLAASAEQLLPVGFG